MQLNPTAVYVIKTVTVSEPRIKVFINVCTDSKIPEPDTIDPAEIVARIRQNEDWVVPIVVSPERLDTDKAGRECLVYDCCMNPNVVNVGLHAPGVRLLTNETCVELIEDAAGKILSREIAFPRMKSKGELSRTLLPETSFTKAPQSIEQILASATIPSNEPTLEPLKPKSQLLIEELHVETEPQFVPAELNTGRVEILRLKSRPTAVEVEQDHVLVKHSNNAAPTVYKLNFVPSKVRAISLPSRESIIYAFH